ncbi:MAG TPA: Hsp70 family protein [Bacillota bacterium]|nr:Hsp70 family protein [Bacillota bacterium]
MAKTIGIDLGTTNSCVAVIEGGEPVVHALFGEQRDRRQRHRVEGEHRRQRRKL